MSPDTRAHGVAPETPARDALPLAASLPEREPAVYDPEQDLAALAEAFPDWRVWRSDEGHWYATRRRAVTPADGYRYGRVRMVDGVDANRLLAELTDQTARDQRARHDAGHP
jgi:hypothetical protein